MAVQAGYAKRMSLVTEVETGAIGLVPSTVGNEGRAVLFAPGRCTFLTKDHLCELHEAGLKPIECRTGFGCKPSEAMCPSPQEMAGIWKRTAGLVAIKLWGKARKC